MSLLKETQIIGVNDNRGRLRVSTGTVQEDYTCRNSDLDTFLLDSAGTGTDTFPFTNIRRLGVTSGQYRVLQSKIHHPYVHGSSQTIRFAMANFGAASNVEKSVGYFSTSTVSPYTANLDGIRLYKDTSNVYSVQIWNNGTQLTTTSLQSANWVDKLDGSGPSRMTINWANFNAFKLEFSYTGVTTLNCAVAYNGKWWTFAQYFHTNQTATPAFQNPNKPMRWEIRSTTGTGNLDMITGSVATEGQFEATLEVGIPVAVSGITIPGAGVRYAMLGVSLQPATRSLLARITSFEGQIKTNDFLDLALCLNPTVAGTFTYADLTGTPLQVATGTALNIVTGGTRIGAGTFNSLNMNNKSMVQSDLARLGAKIDGSLDRIVLVATPTLASTNVNTAAEIVCAWFN